VELAPAWRTHGFQSHHIQLKASIALAAIERNGMYLDTAKVRGAVVELDTEIAQIQMVLSGLKWAPGQGSQTAFDTIMAAEEKALNEIFARTASGKYSRCGDDLGEYRQRSKFINAYLAFQELTKTRNTFIAPLEKGGLVVRGRFNTMVNTGRTSCSGSRDDDDNVTGLNLQNLPREGVVRECLCASPGHVLFACDYSAIELVTLSQHCLARYGFSKMAEAIRLGADLHALDAAFRAGVDVTVLPNLDKKSILKLLGPDADKLRDKSKAKNFGLPGGLGGKTFVEYAWTSYGVRITEEQFKEEKAQWLRTWPEMEHHLASNELEFLANSVMHAWYSHPKVCGPVNFDAVPWPVHVFKGIMCGQNTTKTRGRPYEQSEIDWAWSVATQVAAQNVALSGTQRTVVQTRIQERIAGLDLWNLLAPRQRFVATLTGRLRGFPRYCAARNTPFQGLAADGGKRALYRLIREGFRVVNFIHDEALIEFRIGADHTALAERVKQVMIDEMRSVVPDVPVTCEYALMRRWYKGAKALFINDVLVPSKPQIDTSGNTKWVHDGVDNALDAN
jgi:hypothetical protein